LPFRCRGSRHESAVAQLSTLGFIDMARQIRKKIILIAVVILVGYFGLYFLDAAFGGYDPYFTSDGRSRYSSGLLMHDCIMWQPRFGSYYNEYRHDFIGLAFYPLLWIDGQFVHKTHSIADDSFPKWWESLKAADIHPLYRADYERWKAVDLKYQPMVDAAKARGDTNEVRRIRKLIRTEEDSPK
jgi:hypothetical protein